MIKENQRFLNFINVLLDAAVIFLAAGIAFFIRFYTMVGYASEPFSSYMYIAMFDAPAQILIFHYIWMYEPHRRKPLFTELRKMVAATSVNFAVMFAALYILKIPNFSRLALAIFYVLKNMLMGGKRILLRLILRYMRRSGFNQKCVVIIGSNVMARNCYDELRRSPELGYQVRGYVSNNADWEEVPFLGTMDELDKVLAVDGLDEAFVSLDAEDHHLLSWIIALCDQNGIRFSFIPYYSQFMTTNTRMDSLNGIPILLIRKLPLDYVWNAFVKRSFDVLGSLFLILITSPVMLAVAIGVKLSSPGPIIFRQERIGYGKKPFYMYKFRSMRVNTEENKAWTTDNDPRKTKFGSFIRKYSLDELPQFFNVLKGDMSLVGPRPEIPHFVNQFRSDIPSYLTRQQVRPGITGWAQVNGLRGDTSIEERVKYDRWYIKNWNFGLDIAILLRTLFGGFINSEVMQTDSKKEKAANK